MWTMKNLTKAQEQSLMYVGVGGGNTIYFSKGVLAAYANHAKATLYVADISEKHEFYERHLEALINDLDGYEVVWSSVNTIMKLAN